MTGRHFLERAVDDTPFIFTIKRLKTPLQIHSILSACLYASAYIVYGS
jgi:hypothetical protein